MKGLLELIKLIFGPKALSKTIGTRTNVIRLPNNKIKRYTKSDLDIESASDAAAMNAKKEMEELIAEVPKMNDAERLIFEGNLRRLKNRLGIRSETDPTADVFQFGTKEKITPGGIASLTEKAGQKSPPGTLMGNIESRIKQLEASGEDLSTMKGQTLDEIMGDVASSQQGMRQLEKQGLVRATARDIITSDIKSGKLKLPKELEKQILEGGGEPIDILRNVYGEDALEVLDSLIPEFSKLRTSTEAEKLARSKFKFEPDVNRPKGSMSLEEAKKAEQENILTPGKAIPADSPEGKKITEALIGKPKAEVVSLPTAEKILSDMRKLGPIDAVKEANKVLKREGPYKNLTDKDIEKIMDDINDHIFGGDLPVDPEDFANGGRVGFMDGGSKGLDYLTGMDRKGYADGTEAPVYRILADGSLGPRIITDSMVKNFFGDSPFDGEDLKKAFGEYITFMSDEGYQKEKALNQKLAAGLYQTTNPNIIGYSPSEPAITALPEAQETNKTLAETLFPQGDFLNIRETATSPTQYNIEATKDLVENLPGGIVKDIVAPAVAGVMSLPYDAIQAYQRMQPGSGVSGFAKAYAAERPLQSAFERFVGASGPISEHINKAVSNLNPFQQQKYMQYATENPEQARKAAQRNQDFIQAIQRGNQATGGRVGYMGGGSKGLDYLMGIERRGYAEGTDPTTEALKLLLLPLNNGGGSEANAGGIGLSGNLDPDTKQMTQIETWDPIEGWTPSVVETYSNLSSGLRQTLEGLNAQPGFSNTGPPPGIAGALMGMLGIGRTVNGFVPGSIRGRWDSFSDMFGGNKATDSIDWDAVDRDQAGDTGGDFGGFDSAAEDSDQSGGDAGSTSGADPAGDGGDGYATGGLVNRTKNSQGGLNYLMGY